MTSIRISLITIAFSMLLCTYIILNDMLVALAISQMQQLNIAINNRYECMLLFNVQYKLKTQ